MTLVPPETSFKKTSRQTGSSILSVIRNQELIGATFGRYSFLSTLDREIVEHRVGGLLRLFRRGTAVSVGDAMSCAFLPTVKGKVIDLGFHLFNYSRMGESEEILNRSRNLHQFYHESADLVEQKIDSDIELTTTIREFNVQAHPAAIQELYPPLSASATCRSAISPVTLGILLGKGERQNIIPFLWQFLSWPGDMVVIDDMTEDGSAEILRRGVVQLLGFGSDRLKIIRRPPKR